MKSSSIFVWVAFLIASIGLSFGINYKLMRKADTLELENTKLLALASFRSTEDSLSGKHINLLEFVSRHNYGNRTKDRSAFEFHNNHILSLVLLFSAESCQLCVAKSGEICKMIDSLSVSGTLQVFAIGSGLTLDNVVGYARLGGLSVPLFWDNGQIFRELKIPEGNVYMLLVASDGTILRALVFQHTERLTYHEIKFAQSILNIADITSIERR